MVADGHKSQKASLVGIIETMQSRVYLTASVFILPAVIANLPFVAALGPTISVPLSGFFTILSFGIGLPAALAASPQYGNIKVAELEGPFQTLVDKDGKRIETLYYNRGL